MRAMNVVDDIVGSPHIVSSSTAQPLDAIYHLFSIIILAFQPDDLFLNIIDRLFRTTDPLFDIPALRVHTTNRFSDLFHLCFYTVARLFNFVGLITVPDPASNDDCSST
ncbi:uncharacterized protein MYCFIDRAFT_212105 [Pseudocercospora fijiensis CIRAD86]|uniref:Uncharacterized protein n=1 Tax=Pseudocercospora fijiensis (strain CIRAD86) TaxID=383855 RepID=M3APD8_PSEFD|nr:uncharacterized protein MYCFIDRAFT_212105 [Pseudocercospora fijiensis CIRAD86]EME78993.1 hypothetical protein MYCFIDRAFT_212105 [Pseudocercospora fijiensis CIRAD86]